MTNKNETLIETKPVEPIFKYIGGKTWMRESLKKAVASLFESQKQASGVVNSLDTYIEPFAGGLGAFLAVSHVLLENGVKKVVLNDLNGAIIAFYKQVEGNPTRLVSRYRIIELRYLSVVNKALKKNGFESYKECVDFFKKNTDKNGVTFKQVLTTADDFYKKVRKKFNTHRESKNAPAYLLFLQNHCFNGIYRENASGGHNTPFNWSGASPSVELIKERITAVNGIFKQFKMEFSSVSFESLDWGQKTAIYYLDPPYLNENQELENKYQKDGFTLSHQEILIKKLKGNTFIYSNHNSKELLKFFIGEGIHHKHDVVYRKNIVSGAGGDRKASVAEMLLVSC